MATTTPYYGLHQWTVRDGIRREELNEDLLKIEEALGEKAFEEPVNRNFLAHNSRIHSLEERIQVTYGKYTGDGASSRTITLSDTPRAVLIEHYNGKRSGSGSGNYGGLATDACSCGGSHTSIEIVDGGFCIHQQPGYTEVNQNGNTYCYLAFQ